MEDIADIMSFILFCVCACVIVFSILLYINVGKIAKNTEEINKKIDTLKEEEKK